jgi:hypothetical protein
VGKEEFDNAISTRDDYAKARTLRMEVGVMWAGHVSNE